jgi:hypothetical protein
MPVSNARRLSDFCDVFNPAPVSSSFSSVSTLSILTSFVSRNDPVDMTLLIVSGIPVVLGTVILGNL